MKEKIDITKTMTLVNVFFITFEIPDRLKLSFTEPTREKHMHTFTSGKRATSKIPSVTDIKRSIETFDAAAVDILPLNMYIVVITGRNAFITLQRSCI